MEHSDVLNTLAEIALGTLGFTGVVVALKHSSAKWDDYEKIRFQALVTTTLTAMVSALLPQVIAIATDNETIIWRLANLGIGLMHLTNFSSIILFAIKFQIKPELKGFKDIIDTIVGPSLIILHFVAALGYIPWMQLLLVIGVVQQLYIGISNFLTFISWKQVQ